MAFTKSMITFSVFGNKRVEAWTVTADAAEGTVQTNLKRIDFSTVSPLALPAFTASGNTSYTFVAWADNAGSTGTVAAGQLGFSGCVSTGKYRAVVYGR